MLEMLKRIYDVFMPRFVVDRVAVQYTAIYDIEVVCLERDIEDDTDYDAILTIRSFNLFGVGIFPEIISAE